MQHKFSVWIVPNGKSGAQLQELINTLAEEYDAPKFVPHVTIAGIMAADNELPKVKSKIIEISKQLGVFTINLSGYGYKDENHRCLYVLAKSEQLDLVFHKTAEQFPNARLEHFRNMPHVSLMYGKYPTVLKQEIINKLPTAEMSFEVEKISLCLADGIEEEWRIVYETELTLK